MANVEFNSPRFVKPTFPPILLNAKCIVQFRPRNDWKGEFGFDWFRIGDTGLEGDVNYETIVGQYYDKALSDATKVRNTNDNSWTTFFKVDPQPEGFSKFDKINELKTLYGEYSYSLENDTSGKPVDKKYYSPIIALFPRVQDPSNPKKFLETGEAKLKLYLEFQKVDDKEVKPSKIVFEMDNALMDETHPLVRIDKHTVLEKKLSNTIDIVLTCIADFENDKEIKVWAITQDEKGNETAKLSAGILKIIAPAKKTIKDIVVVVVKTKNGTGNPASLDIFTRNLKQALIKTNITTTKKNLNGNSRPIKIDLSVPANNLYNTNFEVDFKVDQSNYFGNIQNRSRLDYLLIKTLERDYPGQFDNHFKLFFLANAADLVFDASGVNHSSTAGYSHINTDYGVMFLEHSKDTIGHECLHGLGLPHSFFGDSFLYKAQKTDNIMDYSHLLKDKATGFDNSSPIDRISTWYWQWKIINGL